MACRIETALRSHEHVVPERDLRLVQDDAVGVDEDVVPHLDVRAVVTEERLIDDEILTCLADELVQKRGPSFQIRDFQGIVILAQLLGPEEFIQKLPVRGVIQMPGHHFVADAHAFKISCATTVSVTRRPLLTRRTIAAATSSVGIGV